MQEAYVEATNTQGRNSPTFIKYKYSKYITIVFASQWKTIINQIIIVTIYVEIQISIVKNTNLNLQKLLLFHFRVPCCGESNINVQMFKLKFIDYGKGSVEHRQWRLVDIYHVTK